MTQVLNDFIRALRASPLRDLGLALAVRELAESVAARAGLVLDARVSERGGVTRLFAVVWAVLRWTGSRRELRSIRRSHPGRGSNHLRTAGRPTPHRSPT